MPVDTTEAPKIKSSPKDVFMHLLMIAMLYAGTFAFISLWFDYINFLFPDPLNYFYAEINEGVMFAMATIFVVFPVYFFLSWMLGKEMATLPEKRELRVRKWLVYLTLFLAAVVIIVDTVTLMFFFLNGESTARFFLKVLVVFATAAVIFGYYLWDVRKKDAEKPELSKMLASVVAVILIASISYGFFLFGSPKHQRDLRLDSRRVSDLQGIQSMTINYWQQKETLPARISDLEDSISGFVPPVDPETGAAYEYVLKGPFAFELCAVFSAESVENGMTPIRTPVMYGEKLSTDTWSHSAGRVCFERTIDPELYKLNKPIPVIVQ